MKYVLVAVFVFFFVAVPMYVLDTLVMPALKNLQYTYQHADAIANAAAGVPNE